MGKQLSIGVYPPNAFRENEIICALYAEKREFKRSSAIAEGQGDAWHVMECTQKIADIDAMIADLQRTAS